jgi:BlaI family transcriptional regulator, penicillinase repressor
MKSDLNDTPKGRPELSRSEWVVMQTVWKAAEAEPEVTASELLPEILKKRKWHFSTAKTLLDRLVAKGYLASRIRGKTCFYKPVVSQAQTTRKSVASYLDDVLDGAFGPLVAYLADRKGLSKEEIVKLEKLIEGEK